ncbi:MAG: hypothetical protein P1U89_00240 [Verrucomicrobiales bacterium]|nr:hypothetical protein [Verrucomicrobiales bacterium]
MKQPISKNSLNTVKPANDLIETIHSDIKFFTESSDGSFALKQKSIDEIKSILKKSESLY